MWCPELHCAAVGRDVRRRREPPPTWQHSFRAGAVADMWQK